MLARLRFPLALFLLALGLIWTWGFPKRWPPWSFDTFGSWGLGISLLVTGLVVLDLHRLPKLTSFLGLGLFYAL